MVVAPGGHLWGAAPSLMVVVPELAGPAALLREAAPSLMVVAPELAGPAPPL